jgi:two-component system chemotaxis sensor kinase CheA
VVDKIADPLVHMVRNALDHGIETPAARAAAGKSPTGRVELRAFHQAGSIVIQMEGDGKVTLILDVPGLVELGQGP